MIEDTAPPVNAAPGGTLVGGMRDVIRPGSPACQCTACGRYFSGEASFDKHRAGAYTERKGGVRCLTDIEMRERGMGQNARGLWVTALMTTRPWGLPE